MSEFLTQNTSLIFNWILPVLVGAWLVYEKFKNGSYNLRKEIVDDYKERNTQLENQISGLKQQIQEQTENFRTQLQKQSDDFKNEIHTTSLQVAELKGLLIGKDKQIESLTLILQGRNPELTDILTEIKNLNLKIIEFMASSNKKTTEELKYQTEMLERGEERSEVIDKSSKTKDGDLLRIKT